MPTPGFVGLAWPVPMTEAENLGDLERAPRRFRTAKGIHVHGVGGLRIGTRRRGESGASTSYPSSTPDTDVDVRSWVLGLILPADLDGPLYEAVSKWLVAVWPFRAVEYAPRPVA